MGACVRATVEWTRACTGGLQPGTLLASCVTWAVRPLGSLFPVYTAGRERGIPAPQQVGEAAGEVGGGLYRPHTDNACPRSASTCTVSRTRSGL